MRLCFLRDPSIRALWPGLALGAAVACQRSPTVTTRTVTAYVPADCAVDGQGFATYTALGDYEPPPPQPGAFLGAVGAALPQIDPAAQELVVSASRGGSGSRWAGLSPLSASGDVAVLLLPELASCALSGTVGPRAGSTLAPIGGGLVMLTGGSSATATPATYVAHLDTGLVAQVPHDTLRTRASVTEFGAGALVAGGEALDGNGALSDAVVYSASAGDFTAHVALEEARARHGAVVLADGKTLLVGGVGGSDGKTVLGSMELVDPATSSASQGTVARLQSPRQDPVVLRLASAEILVAGGVDPSGQPVTTLEWFAADALPPAVATATAPWAGSPAALIALPAGGALVVAARPVGSPNAWVIGADHGVAQAASVQRPVTAPVLFGGAGGAPLLWTGDAWLQWQPYAGAFTVFESLDAKPPTVGDASCTPDPGLALWLDPAAATGQPRLVGLRFDTRGAFSPIAPATGLSQTAPDRLPGPGVASVDPGSGSLELGPGASAFVTDRTYADVHVEVDSPGAPVAVVLRDPAGHEILVDGGGCAASLQGAPSVTRLLVERRGASVTWSTGGAARGCGAGFAVGDRVAVGVRGAGGAGASVVSKLTVTRLGM